METTQGSMTAVEFVCAITRTVENAEYKVYLKPEVITALVRSGYSMQDAESAADAFFRPEGATLQ